MNREFLCISFFEGVASERFPNQNCHTKVAAAGERDKKLEKERKERKLYNNRKRKKRKEKGCFFLYVIPFATLCTHRCLLGPGGTSSLFVQCYSGSIGPTIKLYKKGRISSLFFYVIRHKKKTPLKKIKDDDFLLAPC